MTMTGAQEWVERAIACGFDPHLVQQEDGEWLLTTSLNDIDRSIAPGLLPDNLKSDVAMLLKARGRVMSFCREPRQRH